MEDKHSALDFESGERLVIGTAWRGPAGWGRALQDLRAHATRDVAFWHDVYADPHDPVRFRRWLTALLSAKGRRLLGADYATRPLAEFAGFYTYRFLSVFTPVATWRAYADAIRRPEDIAPFFARNCAVSMLIRTESLEEDLAHVFARIGRPEITADILRGDRINASRRRKAESYYDEATLKLVADSDPFMVSQFGYAPPGGAKR
ncbi:hypothetical protein [Rhodobacter sp. JA431]|uniref:hypothetical protein n=1 Tax=Rhodobacter sp. JA431 TaxID=570013 RepID=UPI0011604BD0|nr:hypothetical protein [Rhodobacter sp. JA431]